MAGAETRLRAIVVDDEPHAREYVEEMLAAEPTVEVIGSYGDPREAVEAVLRDHPDVLFLDVQMPVLDGFEVLECLREAPPPAVVFMTAYDKHAIDAFDVSAADYLLKPFDAERLHRAVQRAARRAGMPAPERETAPTTAVLDRLGEKRWLRHLPARVGERIVLQRVQDVSWFEVRGKFIHLHVGADQLLVRYSMQSLEERLDPECFVRVSRSAIINVDHVKHLEPWSQGDYVITLRNGDRVQSTQGFRSAIRRLVRFA